MEYNTISENKKLVRYSFEYYEWLLKVLEKRKLNKIWVAFSKTKFGEFEKEFIIKQLGEQKWNN